MANSTLLSLFQTTLQGMGVTTYGMPTTVIGNTNQDVVQTLALVQAGGDDLIRENTQGWNALAKQYVFNANYSTYTGITTSGSKYVTSLVPTGGSYGAAVNFPGGSTASLTTPDSSANSILGDIDIRAYLAPQLWNVGSSSFNTFVVIGKTSGGITDNSYYLQVNINGLLTFANTPDGTSAALIVSISTTAITAAAGSGLYIRATCDVNNGASGNTVTFYTSLDGITWTQLGNAVVNSGTTSIFNSTSQVTIALSATLNFYSGLVYRAQIYNGINGTLAVDLNPADTTVAATSWVSANTGETWTVNGSAKVINVIPPTTNFMVVGTGIQQDCFIDSQNLTTATATLSQPATVTSSSAALTVSQVRYAPPPDFDSQIDRTHWDKSKHWEMLGPSTPQQREWLRSGYISTGPRIRYWYMGGYFQIWPPLGANDALSYEYKSKWWIYATGATATSKQAFTADTDTTIWPDSLMRALIKLKYLEAKGMDTTAALRVYNDQRDQAIANDGGSPTLSMNPRPSSVLIGWENIPDANYGS